MSYRNLILTLIVFTSALVSMSWCQTEEDQFTRTTEKEWTILVFVSADNDLDEYGWGDLSEARKIGSSEDVNIVFQIDRSDGRPCRRFYIEKGQAQLVENMGEVDMGDYRVLTEFFDWGIENYPAEKYAMVVWNHGDGWLNNRNMSMMGISYDDQSGNHISVKQLAQSLSDMKETLGRKLDLLAFDACLMQMIEVAWPLRNYAKVMLGSQEVIPYDGFDYEKPLQRLLDDPAIDAQGLAQILATGYQKSYQGGSQGREATTISWMHLSGLETFTAALENFVVQAKGQDSAVVREILKEVQHFSLRSNRDLRHFMELMSQRSTLSDIRSAASDVVTAFDQLMGLSLYTEKSKAWQPDLSKSQGLAIYFPSVKTAFSSEYLKLDFAKDSSWDEYLRETLEVMSLQRP